MDDVLTRFWSDLVGRLTGPMTFRLYLQPFMGILFATIDGIKDAREGRLPYFWAIFSNPGERGRMLSEGWHRVLRVILLGIGMDVIYQVRVFGRIYPVELLVVVLALAFLPYLFLRGPINRIARRWIRP